MAADTDLVYDGRARKRPSGASHLTQRIYILLDEHPEGLTLDEIHGALAEGWLDTDYYRAYEQHLAKARKSRSEIPSGHAIGPRDAYGSEKFRARAQRWAISGILKTMRHNRATRYDGHRWFKGERAPRMPATSPARSANGKRAGTPSPRPSPRAPGLTHPAPGGSGLPGGQPS
jgi:hypothetical protein